MIKYSWCFLIVILLVTEGRDAEHGLGQSIDDLLHDTLGNDPFSKRITPEILKKLDEKLNTTITDNVTEQQNSTKEERLNGTQILFLKQKREADRLINLTVNRLDEFKNDVDVFEMLTQKFRREEPIINGRRMSDSNNQLLETMLLDAETALQQAVVPDAHWPPIEPNPQKSHLRLATLKYEEAITQMPRWRHEIMLNKIMNMMYTHLYRVQYYVTLAQRQRHRYYHHVRYKLGFCFALQRQLYQEQRALIQTLQASYNNYHRYHGVYLPWALFLYEKINHQQRDIRDIIHHIKQLELTRKMTEEPDYYEFHPSSTGRYSG
ncbi:hypothetical protein O0L34_g2220 [Tuta absoluta]|nr:hypothetical protein O0L34_g2220 [Tuta absoluta]